MDVGPARVLCHAPGHPFFAESSLMLAVPLSMLALATLCDLRTREIPDAISLALLGWAVLTTALGWSSLGWLSLTGGLFLGLAIGCLLFALGGWGGGDVKLVAALGALLGPLGLLQAMFWIALAGGLLAVIAAARGQRDYAYVPAIAAGVIVHWFASPWLWPVAAVTA